MEPLKWYLTITVGSYRDETTHEPEYSYVVEFKELSDLLKFLHEHSNRFLRTSYLVENR